MLKSIYILTFIYFVITVTIGAAKNLRFIQKLWSPIQKIRNSLSRVNAVVIDNPNLNKKISRGGLKEKSPLNVRIDDIWYDLSGWRKAHPSGEHWIDLYRDRDATEVMHAFHSKKGKEMLLKLPKSSSSDVLDISCPPVSQLQRNFRQLRNSLEQQGWWDRDYKHEARLLMIWGLLFAGGLFTAKTIPILSVVLLSLAQTQSGWIGHDYIHGVDKFSFAMRNFGAVAAGLSPTWWSDKHNKHHAVTNEIGADEDLATDPFLYIYPPNPARDSPLRKFQHLTCLFPLSLLFFVWKFDSLKLCLTDFINGFKRKTSSELALLLCHYAIIGSFVPLPMIFMYTGISGLLTAIIVTVTHQSEDLFTEYNPDFVDAQFRSTRNAKCNTVFSDWIWGGMQWQLEHHLFPSMPRSKYPALSMVLRDFAKQNNLEYRITDEWEIIAKNLNTYKVIAGVPSDSSAKHFEGKNKNWGGRGEVVPY